MIDYTRVDAVAAALVGTCADLESVTTESERNSTKFLTALDECVMMCDSCGWWVETDELNDAQECEECVE